jgi:hypothetical protein
MSKLPDSKVAGASLAVANDECDAAACLSSRESANGGSSRTIPRCGSRHIDAKLLKCCRYYINDNATVNFHPSTVVFVIWKGLRQRAIGSFAGRSRFVPDEMADRLLRCRCPNAKRLAAR